MRRMSRRREGSTASTTLSCSPIPTSHPSLAVPARYHEGLQLFRVPWWSLRGGVLLRFAVFFEEVHGWLRRYDGQDQGGGGVFQDPLLAPSVGLRREAVQSLRLGAPRQQAR